MTDRPHRKSGRAPKSDRLSGHIEQLTLDALDAAVYLQNAKGVPDIGRKSTHLSHTALDLELALIDKKGKDETDRLCLDIAATALRILEQGDGH